MLHVSCYFSCYYKSEPKYFVFYNHIIECQSNTLMNLHALEKISFIDARNFGNFSCDVILWVVRLKEQNQN